MDIKAYFSTEAAEKTLIEDRNVIVIDVLRATTTLATALNNGAKCIIPADSVVKARIEHSRFPAGTALLCGERGFDRLEEFDLGNSPFEYGKEVVSGKSLIYTSTNGTRGMNAGMPGRNLVLAAFINFPRPADYFIDLKEDISVICCGTTGYFSLEDAVCGGMYIHYLTKNFHSVGTNDAAEAAVALFKRYRDCIPQMMQMCENGRQLSMLGYHRDVEYCSRIGQIDAVPFRKGKEIVVLE
jgi:2-phosphosulfolactate phosphatase